MDSELLSRVVAIAPEVDRLVWSVRAGMRDKQEQLTIASALSGPARGAAMHLFPFREYLSEEFIRRRYIYRPAEKLEELFDELESGGYLVRTDDGRMVPTEKADAVDAEISQATSELFTAQWEAHSALVERASAMSRMVMEAGRERDGLLQAALASPESPEPYRRFWQRLTALRLLRNEAHVDAWRSDGLDAADIEVLTGAWSSAPDLQKPLTYSDRLVELGYVDDGTVTEAGLAARQRIEDETDAATAEAYSVIDTAEYLEIVRTLPPH